MSELVLITTCGTSLLSNGATPDERKWLNAEANHPTPDPTRLAAMVQARREALAGASSAERHKMSAELNGIDAVLQRYQPESVRHVLVHTDTGFGRAVAELLSEQLPQGTLHFTAADLRTDDVGRFRAGVSDLTRELLAYLEAERAPGRSVFFHLTGGFKSLNAYLQTLGMLCADRCVFLFEGASLIEIPRLPLQLAEASTLRAHHEVFRRQALGYKLTPQDFGNAPDSLWMEIDGEASTSTYGDASWATHRHELFASELFAPLSAKVRVHAAVHRSFDALSANDRVQVNEALDEFCADRDGVRPLLKSRKFVQLRGNPIRGSTHELYATSSPPARRLFGHYEGSTFVFDRLDGHL